MDDGADGEQPPRPVVNHRYHGRPPPPGSSPVSRARTRNFDRQRRADGSVVAVAVDDDDGQQPAVDIADAVAR